MSALTKKFSKIHQKKNKSRRTAKERKHLKRIANRIYRRKNKQRIKMNLEPDETPIVTEYDVI